jgi:hypothetical protein
MKRTLFSIIVILGLFYAPNTSYGQAYCELRDPTKSIHDLYPESSTFQSIVRTIDKDMRSRINKLIPLTEGVHFNELGQHTLYSIFKKERPLGYVHSRSEQSRWGLIEVAWSIGLDMKIKDFRFQRCRNPKKRSLEAAEFRAQLKGKALSELRVMLSKDCKSLNSNFKSPKGAEKLCAALIRCAIKTLVVTAVAWQPVLSDLSVREQLFMAFAERGYKYKKITTVYTDALLGRLKKSLISKQSSGIIRNRVIAYRVLDKKGQATGTLIRANWLISGESATLWVGVNKEGQLCSINSGSAKMKAAFGKMKGWTIKEFKHCKTASELTLLELLDIALEHNK